jgi:hypothetical protein
LRKTPELSLAFLQALSPLGATGSVPATGGFDPTARSTQGKPGARGTRSPCALVVRTRSSPQVARLIRLSLRNGFNGLCRALPGDEFLFVTVAGELPIYRRPGRASQISASLTPATGARTTRFCRTQLPSPKLSADRMLPDEFWPRRLSAGRLRAVRSLTGEPALRSRHAPDAAASTASHPNVRDDGQRPLSRDGMARNKQVICPRRKQKYFCKRGWTHTWLICPSGGRPGSTLAPMSSPG